MTVFTTYFDTSGTEPNAVMLTTGLHASVNTWKFFERRWQRELDRAGIEHFHANRFFSGRKPFEKFRDKLEEQEAVRRRLMAVIGRGSIRRQTAGMIMAAYRKVDGKYRLREKLPPFQLVVGSCLHAMLKWHVKSEPLSEIQCFHEKGDTDQGKAIVNLGKVGLELIPKDAQDSSGKWILPFQAADLVAWELRRGAEATLEHRTSRRSFKRFMTAENMSERRFLWHDTQTIEEICRRNPSTYPLRGA